MNDRMAQIMEWRGCSWEVRIVGSRWGRYSSVGIHEGERGSDSKSRGSKPGLFSWIPEEGSEKGDRMVVNDRRRLSGIFVGITAVVIFLVMFVGCDLKTIVAEDSHAIATNAVKVLFIGNSLTYFWDMPGIVGQLASSKGHLYYILQSTEPNVSLSFHVTYANTQAAINYTAWDFVVLQNNSYGIAFPEYLPSAACA